MKTDIYLIGDFTSVSLISVRDPGARLHVSWGALADLVVIPGYRNGLLTFYGIAQPKWRLLAKSGQRN